MFKKFRSIPIFLLFLFLLLNFGIANAFFENSLEQIKGQILEEKKEIEIIIKEEEAEKFLKEKIKEQSFLKDLEISFSQEEILIKTRMKFLIFNPKIILGVIPKAKNGLIEWTLTKFNLERIWTPQFLKRFIIKKFLNPGIQNLNEKIFETGEIKEIELKEKEIRLKTILKKEVIEKLKIEIEKTQLK